MTSSPDPHPSRLPVGVLGATGSVGQRFVSLLAAHPWFEPVVLTASQRSAGRAYGDAVSWAQSTPIPESVAGLEVRETAPGLPARLLFSALDSAVAGPLEEELAAAGHVVVSNARNHRMDPDVPLVVPEVNPAHLGLARAQTHGGGEGRGAIFANPNCSTIGLVMALKPLVDAFGVRKVSVVTLQAASGAGIPGVPSMALLDNVVPYIPGEEEKLEQEGRKILGRLTDDVPGGLRIEPAALTVSAQVTRVPVVDGHTLCISVELATPGITPEDAEEAFAAFTAEPQELGLPTAPPAPVIVTRRLEGPQPRLDRDRGAGMAVTVGRVRPCSLLHLRFVALVHNTLRGAAGGALLLAELARAKGLLEVSEDG